MDVSGIALVVGAGSGIGRACSLSFAKEGSSGIMIADVNFEAAMHVAEECRAQATNPNFKAEPVQVDVTSQDSVNGMAELCGQLFSRIDYCVNCAGIGVENTAEIGQANIEEFDRFLKVNVTGSFLVTRRVSAMMAAQEPRAASTYPGRGGSRGSIVNMGSASSYVSTPGMVQYTTSKHAVLGLTKNSALDNAAHSIRVNCICASWVDTPMVRRAIDKVPSLEGLIQSVVPMGRMALPEEVADSVLFLCSPRSSYITGCGLIMDGGTTLTQKI